MVEASLPGTKPEGASISTMDDTLTIRYAEHWQAMSLAVNASKQ